MTTPRLHDDAALAEGAVVALDGARAHYLSRVLRLRPGGEVRIFNIRDGEWRAVVQSVGRHRVELAVRARLRPPLPEPGPRLVFAPIRQNRMDWLVEKAVELGAEALVPILTRRAVVRLGRTDRLQAIAIEAAEQCGRLSVPLIEEPLALAQWLAERAPGRPLLVADPASGGPLASACTGAATRPDVVIGPEGGFDPEELAALLAVPDAVAIGLGPRMLRSETACLAALALLIPRPGDG